MKVNIDIPDDMLKAVDKEAEKGFFSRSEWIRTAIRDKLHIYPEGIQVPAPHPIPPVMGTTPPENITQNNQYNAEMGFCKLHWEPVKGKMYPIKVITWEDENGFPIVNKQPACPECVKKYQDKDVGHLYIL